MSNILLYTNDLELGTTLSERLLHGNNTIMFVEQLLDLNIDSNLLIIDLDDKEIKPNTIIKIIEKYSTIRVVGIMKEIQKKLWNDYRNAGCEMIFLRSVLIKNIDTILSNYNLDNNE
ncbi:MAG: hypothetical protein VX260_06230 [Candidatus Neomarinimicrobiota bacterium]|nr:hypothetical protein [Candidatus Neomarinimicrobiota bacterium]